VINSFGLIQNTLITKNINFKVLTKVTLISTSASGIIGITMAYSGYGVWSLVAQQVLSSFFRTILLWLMNKWRPALVFSITSLRSMFGFGSRILASGLIDQIFNNIYLLVIGKLFSSADLGFFTRAQSFEEIPMQTLSTMFARVTYPVFATIQDDPARLKRGMRKAMITLVLATFPIMIGLAVIARPLVMVLLTEKWSPCVRYLQLLCIAGILYPLHVLNLNLLQAMGRSDLLLRLEIIKKSLIAVSILITYRWGISALIYGMIATGIICYYLNSYYTAILIRYSVWEQMRDVYPYMLVSLLMGLLMYLLKLTPIQSNIYLLAAQITFGCFMFICACLIFRLEAFMEIWRLGLKKLSIVNVQQ
jgi:O-antigen/teichoic acid export membrane protein